MAGAMPELVHLDALISEPARIDEYSLFGFPGGFSYGDDIASGRIFAMKVRERLYPHFKRAVERGCPIIGACNGFQTLVQVGLLPGPKANTVGAAGSGAWPDTPPAQTVALTDNQDARFRDRWVPVVYERESVCVWTRGLLEHPSMGAEREASQLPAAHGEGRFVAADEATLNALEANGQVVLRYADNYNGSQRAIAGICDASGLVFGLMPHPERFLEWNRHPWWTRLEESSREAPTPGLVMFQNAVGHVQSAAAGGVWASRRAGGLSALSH
jgi:phosphoribosylformylglycinamidine synthase